MNEIPQSWIQPLIASSGFLPDVGAHVRGRSLVQEQSRTIWAGAIVMCSFALLALVPISDLGFRTLDIPYYVQVVVALGCVWGAICVVVGSKFIDSRFGTSVVFDPGVQTIVIRRSELEITIPTNRVIGLQVLRGPRDTGGYQLNLVFRQENGDIARESLTTNAIRYYVMRLAKAYQRFAGWPLLEVTEGQSPH